MNQIVKILFNQSIRASYGQFQYSSLTEKLQKRQEKTMQEEYKKEIEFLASKPTFTLMDYRQRILDSLAKTKKGLKAKFASGVESTEAQLTQQKIILNAMFDDELLNHDSLDGIKKKEIAMVAQVKVEEVNQMLQSFKHMHNLQKWIRESKERGEVLPENQEELLYKFRKDKPISKSFLKFEYRVPQLSKKQRLQKLKWSRRKQV